MHKNKFSATLTMTLRLESPPEATDDSTKLQPYNSTKTQPYEAIFGRTIKSTIIKNDKRQETSSWILTVADQLKKNRYSTTSARMIAGNIARQITDNTTTDDQKSIQNVILQYMHKCNKCGRPYPKFDYEANEDKAHLIIDHCGIDVYPSMENQMIAQVR